MNHRPTYQRVGQIRGRRGIVLVFVVVLLVLLAIMGTAYLSVTRLDRQGVTGRGALTGQTSPRMNDRSLLDQLHASAERAVKNELIRDLFNVSRADVRVDITQPLSNSNRRTVDAFAAMQGGIDPLAQLDAPNSWTRFRQQMGVDDLPFSDATVRYIQTYENYDAPGRADPFLASLLPERRNPADLDNPRATDPVIWPWISGLLSDSFGSNARPEPFFSDPRYLNSSTGSFTRAYGAPPVAPTLAVGTDVTERRDVMLNDFTNAPSFDGTVKLGRNANIASADNTRVYPAFKIPSLGGVPFIAADADGDGIADSGMMPIAINTSATGVARYVDTRNGVIYFVGYRVVDNSGQININTALSVTGDFTNLAVTQNTNVNPGSNAEARNFLRANQPDAPNLGFFRSNIGLLELVTNSLHLSSNSSDPFGNNVNASGTSTSAMYRETSTLIDTKLPLLAETPAPANTTAIGFLLKDNQANPVGAEYALATRNSPAGPAGDFRFQSIGDLLENQIVRRNGSVGQLAWPVNAGGTLGIKSNGVNSFTSADAVSLAFKGGTLINPNGSTTSAENALLLSTRLAAPNFTASGSSPWQWFPPAEVNVWFEWTKDFDVSLASGSPGALAVYDSAAGSSARYFDYNAAAADGLQDMRSPRSIRSLLTTRNGVTAKVPMRGTVEQLTIGGNSATAKSRMFLPMGMPSYEEFPSARTYEPMPAVKASAATSTKEELWRAYWSAMTTSSALLNLPAGQTPDPADLVDNGSGTMVPSTHQVTKRSYWLAERNVPVTAASNPPSFDYDSNSAQVYEAFKSPDRHASDPVAAGKSTNFYSDPATGYNRLDERQMTLLRSAIAACNTIDLRDSDQDITAMTVDLGPATAASPSPAMIARVYGNEKQLAITGVVVDIVDARVGAAATDIQKAVAVEIYNPTDEPISLAGYVIASVERQSGVDAGGNPITLANGLISPGTPASRYRLNGATKIDPGDYLLLLSTDENDAQTRNLIPVSRTSPTTNGADPRGLLSPGEMQIISSDPDLRTLLEDATSRAAAPGAVTDHELALFRTRRADGIAYNETPNVRLLNSATAYHRPELDENIDDVTTLVPIDAVDTRTLILNEGDTVVDANAIPLRYYYLRQTNLTLNTTGATPQPQAWKCYYAGRTFKVRTDDHIDPSDTTTPRPVPAKPDPRLAATTDYAWNRYANSTSSAVPIPAAPPENVKLGVPHDGPSTGAANPGTPEPLRAPTIPLQNFKPDPSLHPLTQFPYGTPFARDGDLLSVPFIGSYKIYRVTFTGGSNPGDADYVGNPAKRVVGTTQLYEYVPITMDAVSAAPNPAYCVSDPSVARFDPEIANATGHRYTNQWATDLFDFVTARQSPRQGRWPDMPTAVLQTTGVPFNDPTNLLTDQDGPVQGVESTVPANRNMAITPWIRWKNLNTGTGIAASRGGDDLKNKSSLVQGKLNPNTAPPVLMRLLPFAPALNGQITINAATQQNRVAVLNKKLYDPTLATNQGLQVRDANLPPFGFESVFDLGSTLPTTNATADLLNLGMLNPLFRPPTALDPIATKLDAIRLSNLVTPRSDVFTVYVTVQAWTYVGDPATGGDQTKDTRLVGEKRSSFIVDRSAITGDKFQPSDLIVLPVDDE